MEKVTVTIRAGDPKFESDYELPAYVSVKQLSSELLETLKYLHPQIFGGYTELIMRHGSHTLERSRSLAQLDIWDGSIIDIVLK